MTQRARIGKKRDLFNFVCLDCQQNLLESGEYYMLHDDLWARINPRIDGQLCIDCAERRLGRRLTPDDFTDAPINAERALMNRKLAERVYGNDLES